jgi:hypothetical protein
MTKRLQGEDYSSSILLSFLNLQNRTASRKPAMAALAGCRARTRGATDLHPGPHFYAISPRIG